MKHERIAAPSLPPSTYFWRAIAAQVRGFVEGIPPERAAARMYPDDPTTPLVLRAATTQATTTDPAWAGPLAHYAVSEAIEDIVAMSVTGRLELAGALRVSLGRNASVRVPGRAVAAIDAGQWVQEGHPIPARNLLVLAGPTLTPQKLSCIATMTRELTEASNIENVVRRLLTESAGIALDAAMFSASAATAAQPGGLLNGLTALTPSTGAGFDAVGLDLGALVGDIATRGGGAHAFFVGAPAQATAIRFYAGGQFYETPQGNVLPVAGSAGLPNGTVAAVEPESLAFAIEQPEFSVSSVAAIHQEDTTPANIVSGTPATPVKAMFQIDALALRMNIWACWGMRAPHVSFMNAVNW